MPKTELAFTLLKNLPNSYSHIVVTLDGREEACDFEYLLTARLQQEEQRQNLQKQDQDEKAFMARGSEQNQNRSWNQGPNRQNSMNNTNTSSSQPNQEVICFYCKGQGHFLARGCAKKAADYRKRRGEHANLTTEIDTNVALMASIQDLEDRGHTQGMAWYISICTHV